MGLSFAYHPMPSEEQSIELIKHAYDQGVTFFDTADMYGPFTNEVLVGKVEEGSQRNLSLILKSSSILKNVFLFSFVIHKGS